MTSKSPRDILLVVMKTLDPHYHMSMEQTEELYKKLKRDIVAAPASPHTNPDTSRRKAKLKHRKEYIAYNSSRVSSHFRAPDSVNQSFYLHHSTPLFQQLFPQVDLSTYEKPKKAEPSHEEDRPVRAQIPTPEAERHLSTSLPSSPPQFSLVVEDYSQADAANGEIEHVKHDDNGSEEDQSPLTGEIKDEDLLPGESAESPDTLSHTTKMDRIQADDKVVGDESDIDLQGTQMSNSQSSASADDCLNECSLDEASQDMSLNTHQDSVFSRAEPLTQDTIASEFTATQSQDPGSGIQEPSVTKQLEPSEPRRSQRLAKKPTVSSKDRVATSSSAPKLGKRSRRSDTTADDKASKRRKA
jgi:hypothetical protein